MENYRFIEKIGRGTHGTAYLLRSEEDSRYVVCKSVIDKYLSHAHKEISILGQLNHKRVIRKIDNIQMNGSIFIILEYANYGTLERMIQYFSRGKTGPGACLGWSVLSQISDALYYIHSKKIIHRDIKPANILVNKFWVRDGEYLEFKLCDFSLATTLNCHGEKITDGATIGTPFYMAPEMIKKLPYGATVDVWGMGVVLYEMLRQTKPFKGDNRATLYREILEKEIELDGLCTDRQLSEIIGRCLLKEGRVTAREIAKNERIRLNLTMLELKYRESRIEMLENKLKEYECREIGEESKVIK
ncbi:hypothetical protein PAEPH01_1421 [Pancytospora epiphaga]|nr:hypothetical protein PAEPH01_1421 [Pancytospora epiphaga]